MTHPQTLVAAEENEAGASGGRRIPVNSLLAFGLFFVSAVLLQLNSGAYQGDFTGASDEASHFVTGLLVRDYVAAGAPVAPMEYAENYYRHYPKVAMGHFPPGFYALQGAWTLLFPPSRISIMLLMALGSALLATGIHAVVWAEYSSHLGGIGAGLVWLSLQSSQSLGRAVMADIFVALLALIATLAWSRYLEKARVQDAIQFGLLASIALLTKGTAIALAVVPIAGTLLSGKLRLAGRWSFWLPAVMVIVLCSPWYLMAPAARHESADFGLLPTVRLLRPFSLTFRTLLSNFGLAALLLIAAGFFIQVIHPLLKRCWVREIWACLAALAISITLAGIALYPARGVRHIAFGMPAYTVFLAAGVAGVISLWPFRRFNRAARTSMAALAAAGLIAYNVVSLQPVHARGFSAVAEDILSDPANAKSILLVSSDGVGEGSLVSEIARREPVRPTHVVLRASSVLASDSWSGAIYELRYETAEEMAALLRRVPVEFVILDRMADPVYPHQNLLSEVIRQSPDSWERVGEYTDSEGTPSIEVFRQVDVRGSSVTPMHLDRIPGLESLFAR